MAKDTTNPFVLPGFGQQGDAAQNPLFAGLEMMNQAWQNLAQGGQMGATPPTMSTDELDKKIRELRTVQNWLQLNSTMLANTIQGLEIQRSTLAMMKSFATASTAEGESKNPDYTQAANEWWNVLQQQFEQMAKATTESLQTMAKTADKAAKPAAKKATKTAKSTKPSTTKSSTKSSTKSTRKS